MPDTGSGFTYFRSGAERAGAEPAPEPEVEAQSVEVEETDDYPEDGTIPEVKEWIGDDLARAGIALGREQAKSNPRTTLLDYLDSMLSENDDDVDA